MKKIILFSFVCLSTELFAQKSFFGIDAGVNVANQRLVVRQLGSTTSGGGFFMNLYKPTFGFFYQLNFLEQLGVRINAQYMGLGSHYQYSGIGFSSSGDTDINYLTFPVSLNYKANKLLSLNVGSYFSFKLNENTSGFHKNDFGFYFGGEHDVYKNFSLSVNYYIGVKNIILNDQGGRVKSTNRALQFTLIYKFRKPVTAK